MVEKRAARREDARARGESPDHPGRGVDLMGDADDSFAAARAQESQRNQWRTKNQLARQDVLQQKLSAAQAEENAKLDPFRALLAKGPITIRKRE